jgi:hypothetical protein
MKVLIRSAVSYRKRARHGPFNNHYPSGLLCETMQEYPGYFRRIVVVLFFIGAVILSPPVSAFSGQEVMAGGLDGNSGNAAGPVIALVTPVPPSGTYTFPSIAPNETTGVFCREFTFPFQKTNVTIAMRVNASLYHGAKNGDKFATVPEGVIPEDEAPAYYRAFIDDPRQDGMYGDLLSTFRAIRQEHRYTNDEYLELLTVFVQSLPYDTVPGTRPDTPARFPVETLVDGTGDCDDKSLLLAGLLAREGYDAALLLFLKEHHMAVGVRDGSAGYRNTGYLYVETTGVSLIGVVPANLSQPMKYVTAGESPRATALESTPLVIREGTGTRLYTSADETSFIAAQKKAVDETIALLRGRLDTFSEDNPTRYQQLMEDYYVYTGIHNTLVKNLHDRAGEYQYLKKIAPEFLCTGPTDNHPAGVMALPDFSFIESGPCQACFPLTLRRPGQCSPGNHAALSR